MDVCTQCGLPLTKKIFRGKKKRARGHFCCYGCYLTFQITREKGEQGKAQGVLIRLGLGIFFAMNVMLFSLPTYSSFFYSLESNGVNETNFLFFLRIGLIAFSTPVLALLGFPILLNSIKEISHVSFSVDTLIALGTFAAYSLSIYNTFTLKEHVYFDTATMLLVLVTLGRYLEARAKVKTADSLNRLIGRTPLKAQLICGDTEKEIDTEKIQVGDKIKILPGQMFPVDGKVLKGTGGVDESSLTGEHQPVYKKVEDKVVSGSISVDGTFVIATEKVQAESTLARIAKLLEEAKNSRAPIERTANQIAAIFIPLVISIAIVACIFWSLRTNLENGLLTSLSVLVVSCPCALGIATPIAIWLAFNQTLQKGILLRNGETLECLSRLKKIFFDKTGTLTSGNLMFKQLVMHPAIKKSRSDLEQKIVSLAAHSSHPIAACILNALPFKKQSPQNVS
ncbi:MAG: heavy metal translocating P-type ATPase, partial [bacterium]